MDTIDLLMNMIRIPSVSREEGTVADFLEGWMKDQGFDVRRSGNNLWVESGPEDGRPTVLLNAHMTLSRLRLRTDVCTVLAAMMMAAPLSRFWRHIQGSS